MTLTPAHSLTGLQLPNGWTVEAPLQKAQSATGGWFSASYTVVDDGGERAFLKAIDFIGALQSHDPTTALQELTERFNFERDLVGVCRDRRMSRVVRIIDHGTVDAPGGHALPQVSYLIFELGDGDIRKYREISGAIDVAWALRSLHGVALGLKQLHDAGIAHQDLKPSNVMTFAANLTKIGDLGRASRRDGASPFDSLNIAGDTGYAPPELLYGFVLPSWDERRRAADLFQLGSLLCFQFTGVNATGALLSELNPAYRPQAWGGTYDDVALYLRDALSRVMAKFPVFGDDQLQSSLLTRFRELCEPDPRLRGHPRSRKAKHENQYSLERYVSAFDALASRATRLTVQILTP